MRKLVSLLLTVTMLLGMGMIVGVAAEGDAPTKIMFYRVAVQQDPTTDRLLLELQKRTNTIIEFITAPWDSEVTRIMTILSSGEQVDVMSMNTTAFDFPSLCRDGLLLQLDDYLATDNYPMLKKLAYGDVYFPRYNVDGNAYGIPLPQTPGDWNNYIRSDWLERLGLAMPTTPDEMYEVLKAFKFNDPDGNGVDDTIGVCLAQANGGLNPVYAMFMPSYGNAWQDVDGELEWLYVTDMYKEALTYINRLYREEIINQDLFDIKDREYVRYQFSAGISGWVTSPMISGDYNELLAVDPTATVELMAPLPHQSPSTGAYAGDSGWSWMNNVLPSTCSNPEKVLELLEYLHSPEGRKLICVGIESIHYERYEELPDGSAGIFYGISAEEQGKDWDPAKGEGPTGSPMWWGMVSTINGTIPVLEYDSLQEALKNSTMFVSEEDYENNPYWDMRMRGSQYTNHNYMPDPVMGWLEYSSSIDTVRQEYEASMILADPGQIDALFDEYLSAIDGVGFQEAMAAVQEWYQAQ